MLVTSSPQASSPVETYLDRWQEESKAKVRSRMFPEPEPTKLVSTYYSKYGVEFGYDFIAAISNQDHKLSQLELEQLRFLEHGIPVRAVAADYRGRTEWEVNFPKDVRVVERLLASEGELTS